MMSLETMSSERFGVVVHQRFRGWVVVQRFDDDAMQFTGYSAISRKFIKHLRKPTSFINKAITMGMVRSPVALELEVHSIGDLLSHLQETNVPVLVYREKRYPDELLAGLLVETDRGIKLKMLSPTARWESATRIEIEDLTRLDFGGPYEKTLFQVAGAR